MAKKFKTNTLFIVQENVNLFKKEIYMYVWNKDSGEPVKKWDDVMDALRYAVYTDNSNNKVRISSKARLGIR